MDTLFHLSPMRSLIVLKVTSKIIGLVITQLQTCLLILMEKIVMTIKQSPASLSCWLIHLQVFTSMQHLNLGPPLVLQILRTYHVSHSKLLCYCGKCRAQKLHSKVLNRSEMCANVCTKSGLKLVGSIHKIQCYNYIWLDSTWDNSVIGQLLS